MSTRTVILLIKQRTRDQMRLVFGNSPAVAWTRTKPGLLMPRKELVPLPLEKWWKCFACCEKMYYWRRWVQVLMEALSPDHQETGLPDETLGSDHQETGLQVWATTPDLVSLLLRALILSDQGLCSWPHLTLITSQRSYPLIPSHWQLGLQYKNLGET